MGDPIQKKQPTQIREPEKSIVIPKRVEVVPKTREIVPTQISDEPRVRTAPRRKEDPVEPTTIQIKWSDGIHQLQKKMEKQMEKSKQFLPDDVAKTAPGTTQKRS